MNRYLKLAVGTAVLATLSGCMVAGRDADIADLPGMASVQTVSGSTIYHECGATMIAPTAWKTRAWKPMAARPSIWRATMVR